MLYGYNTKWNLKKCSVPAIKAGSCFCVALPEAIELPEEMYFGEDKCEGYGLAVLYDNDKLTYRCESFKEQETIETSGTLLPWLCESIQQKLIREELNQVAFKNEINVNAATLGRITLMLKESLQEKGYLNFKDDFQKRIGSIKRDNTRKEAEKFLHRGNVNFEEKLSEAEEKYKAFSKTSNKVSEWNKEKLRYEFLMNLLVYKKYCLKNE